MGSKLGEFAALVARIVAAGGAGEIDELVGLALVRMWPGPRRRWWRVTLEPVTIGA